MRFFGKIERSQDKQSVEVVQPIRRFEIPFYKQLMNLLGWITLKLNRPLILPENTLTWSTLPVGYEESNLTLDWTLWHGLKFVTEYCRGEIARMESHPDPVSIADLWVFNAGDVGAYRISAFVEFEFADQDAADFYALEYLIFRLAKDYLPLDRVFMKTSMRYRTAPIQRLWAVLNGTDVVYLKKGQKLSIFAKIFGAASVQPMVFTIKAHCAINYLGKDTRLINQEETIWALV